MHIAGIAVDARNAVAPCTVLHGRAEGAHATQPAARRTEPLAEFTQHLADPSCRARHARNSPSPGWPEKTHSRGRIRPVCRSNYSLSCRYDFETSRRADLLSRGTHRAFISLARHLPPVPNLKCRRGRPPVHERQNVERDSLGDERLMDALTACAPDSAQPTITSAGAPRSRVSAAPRRRSPRTGSFRTPRSS